MKESMEIPFEDASFPIKINPGRASVVDDVGSASRALHEAIEIKYFYEGDRIEKFTYSPKAAPKLIETIF